MGWWTRREWVEALVLILAGFLAARLFPDFWEGVVIPLAAVAFVLMMVRHVRRENRKERERRG